jgi:serine/threonine protein phosphatase PrpC
MPLSAPVTATAIERSAGALGMVAAASMQGVRANHEDAHCIDHALGFAAVFDGHVGDEAAAFAAERLPLHMKAHSAGSPQVSLPAAYLACEKEMKEHLTAGCEAGTTATLALVENLADKIRICVANLGDSRAVLWHRSTGKIEASKDHRPDDADERKRIEAAGGTVDDTFEPPRIDGRLACSRALGSFAYKTGSDNPAAMKVSSVPDFYEWTAQAGDMLLLGCDGVFDCLSNEQLVKEVCEQDESAELGSVLAKTLQLLIKKDSDDNMSLVAIKLGRVEAADAALEVTAGDFLKTKDKEVLEQYVAFCKRYGYELKKEMVPKAPPKAALTFLGPVPRRYEALAAPAAATVTESPQRPAAKNAAEGTDVKRVRVTAQKSAKFYCHAFKKMLEGELDGKAAPASIEISALGNAISVATAAASLMQSEGFSILCITTGYQSTPNAKADAKVAVINIVVAKS